MSNNVTMNCEKYNEYMKNMKQINKHVTLNVTR